MKTCIICGNEKQYSEFNKRGLSPDGHQNRCRGCSKAYYAGRKDIVREQRRSRAYGLTNHEYVAMLESQDFKCLICEDAFDLEIRHPNVDHNHATGEVRGILCNGCNTGLGNLKDNPFFLRKAADYLESKGFYG